MATIPQTLQIPRVPGQAGFGSAVRLGGSSPNQYVQLPDGVVSSLSDFTIATWVNRTSASGQTWSRLFDFGTGTAVNMFLTVDAGGAAGARFAITLNGGGGEQQITAASPIPTGWHHVAVTRSGNVGTLWVDGNPVATNNNLTLSPSSMGNTTNNWIGRSQYGADPPLQAEVDDFHIFDRALCGIAARSADGTARRWPARWGQRRLAPLRRARRGSRGRLVGTGERQQDLPVAELPDPVHGGHRRPRGAGELGSPVRGLPQGRGADQRARGSRRP